MRKCIESMHEYSTEHGRHVSINHHHTLPCVPISTPTGFRNRPNPGPRRPKLLADAKPIATIWRPKSCHSRVNTQAGLHEITVHMSFVRTCTACWQAASGNVQLNMCIHLTSHAANELVYTCLYADTGGQVCGTNAPRKQGVIREM
jgi:hypothetical protein